MILELKAKHFKGTDYVDSRGCAITKAYRELTGNYCTVGLRTIEDENNIYLFKMYDFEQFKQDHIVAESHDFNETVIRTIELS